jgi:hypothetical protein
MNGAATFGDEYGPESGIFCGAQIGRLRAVSIGEGTMTNAMVALGIAVGGASLIFCALMTRLQNRNRIRRSSGDSSSAGDSATYATGDGWNHGRLVRRRSFRHAWFWQFNGWSG